MNQKYQICSSISQYSGKKLEKPVIHQNKTPCYFNLDEYVDQRCPVCNTQFNNPYVDQKFQQVLIEKQGKQILKFQDQYYYIDKCPYNQYLLSDDYEIRGLQQQMIDKVNNESIDQIYDLYQNELLDAMQQMNSQIKPLLIAIVSNKMVFFYHTLKIRISLPIYLKRRSIQTEMRECKGQIIQILEFADKVFALHFADNENVRLSTLYQGDVNQVYECQQKRFILTQMNQYSLTGSAHLVVIDKERLLMIGSNGYYIIKKTDLINKKITETQEIQQHKQIEHIKDDSSIFYQDNQLIIINKQDANIMSIYIYAFDTMTQKYYKQISNKKFNLILPFDKQLKMINTNELNKNYIDSISFPGNEFGITSCSVMNHSSYMLVKPSITTVTQLGKISCCIVELILDKTILPAILVYNIPNNCFEVELI